MKPTANIQKSEKGQSLVELAVSLLILVILLAGVVDIGSLFFEYLALRDSAQEGAAFIAIYPDSCNQAIERVKANLNNVNPANLNVEVLVNGKACHTASASDACVSKEAKIIVTENNIPITMPLIGAAIGTQDITLKATITDTIIRPVCP